MKIRNNPIFPRQIDALSRELSVLWRELANSINSTVAGTSSSSGLARNSNGTDTTDDIIIDTFGKGVVLKSPDGHYWRVQVDNTGTLTVTDLGTTKP